MDELISVIVPVYNVEKYINKCIDSIINQTYKNLEIILVDDGTLDNCGKICDEYEKKDNRIKVIHKENGGLSDARNAGIEISKGSYITLVDADDYILEDYVEFLYNILKENKAEMSVCKHMVIYDNGGEINTGSGKEYVLSPKEALKMMLYGDDFDVSAWGKLYSRQLFENVKYPKGRVFEDAATTYKLIDLCNTIAFKSEAKYIYFVRENSITTKSFNPKKMDLITSTGEMTKYVMEKYPDLENAANRRLMYSHLSTLTQLVMSNKKELPDYKKYENEIVAYIKENRAKVLKDGNIPKRDRVALICTIFGMRFYTFFWKIYRKITGRK